MKELSHLKRLSAVKSSAGIKFLTPAVSPGNHCPMRFASAISEEIEGLSSLLVGMPECATHSRLFSPKPEGSHGELHWLYVLDAHEVVFGCREGVMNALVKMDQAGAKAILMIVTCVPELIGEDMEGIIREIQPRLSARVVFVMLGQFKNVSYPPGSWKTMEAMGSLMDAKTTDQKRINVLGRSPCEEHIPMPSLLPALCKHGFLLRYLAPGASLRDFQNAPDASLNLVVSPFTQPLAVKMEQEFGVPYVALHTLYEVNAIDRAYKMIAERFGFCWEGEFDRERDEALALQQQARKRLEALKFILTDRIDMPVALAVYLAELGMKPLLLHLDDYYGEDNLHAKRLNSMGYDPWICRMVNMEDDFITAKKLKPDLFFGYLPEYGNSMACVSDMYDFYGQTGFGRTAVLLKRIFSVLKDNPQKGGTVYGSASL